jgi:hypothetical protein
MSTEIEDVVADGLSGLLGELVAVYGVSRPALVVNLNPNPKRLREYQLAGYRRKVSYRTRGFYCPRQAEAGWPTDTIVILDPEKPKEVLIHEFAHHVAGIKAGHGPLFMAHLRAVSARFGIAATDCCN